ncbi:putative C2H2 finger domain protein [Aspergillus stella-maris]|uniref:putative C2H2 finger domain protein n=1 Tax=Aspergillus stella-maris TaxID=1810926 RepID=UPI003CCDD2E1
MEDHYSYPEYHHYPSDDLSIAQEVQFYQHHDANALVHSVPDAMMGCVTLAQDAAVKNAQFPPFGPYQYPPPPSAPEMAYLAPRSSFEESVRSVSPQTDCHSSGFAPSLSYDDSMSCASGFESSPSPPYHEPMQIGFYRQDSMASPPEHVQQLPQQSNHMFIEVYTPHQPSEFMTTSPTTSKGEQEPTKTPRKARKESDRSRVQKRTSKPGPKKIPAKSNRTQQATASKPLPKKTSDRRFECCFARYGCTSTFPSKNEWKRHVSSQHIQLGFFRCDVGRCSLNNVKHPNRSHSHSPSPSTPASRNTPPNPTLLVNDFNRKDLFIQHQRRMHSPWSQTSNADTGAAPGPGFKTNRDTPKIEKEAFEATLESVTKRCWQQLRTPPTLSRCGFCNMEFRGANAWKERMEHVARHLEKRDPGPEREDEPLRAWAEENGVIRFIKGQWKLSGLCGK